MTKRQQMIVLKRILLILISTLDFDFFLSSSPFVFAFTTCDSFARTDFPSFYVARRSSIQRAAILSTYPKIVSKHQQKDQVLKVRNVDDDNDYDECSDLRDGNKKNEQKHVEDSYKRRPFLVSLLTRGAVVGGGIGAIPPVLVHNRQSAVALETEEEEDWWSNVKNSNILKPPLDDRLYETYILPSNNLRVVLCSDVASKELGVAMDVHVGSSSDPTTVRGLAHFQEHMLFLGTRDYPNENSFEEFVSTNGGSSNAYTASEDTVYYFTLQSTTSSTVKEGLKRFGSFFINPLFTESATGRELNAIESEHSKNIQTDVFRISQLDKLIRFNPEHPNSKFFTGNKQTLLKDTQTNGKNLRSELGTFNNRYYSSNQMTLAIVGPQSISEMKSLVEEAFGSIPNKHVLKPETAWNGILSPFVLTTTSDVIKVVPVKDVRQVILSWPIVYNNKSDQRTNSRLTKQSNYISHLLGHEGPKSLLSYLKNQKGWAYSIFCGRSEEHSDYEMFQCTVALTKDGLNHVYDVVDAIFAYIGMMIDGNGVAAIPEYTYDEVLQLEELSWRYMLKGEVSGYVTSLATALQLYPPSLCIAGPRRLALLCDDDDSSTVDQKDSTKNNNNNKEEKLITSSRPRTEFKSKKQLTFTKKLTKEYILSNLTVENVKVMIISKTFEGKTNAKEKWYGTDYKVERIPESTLNQWKQSTLNGPNKMIMDIDFPKPNPFIPTESGLILKYPLPLFRTGISATIEQLMKPLPPPTILQTNEKWTVYYKADKTYGQPNAFFIFQLVTSNVYSNLKNAALSTIYEYCVVDKLTEYAYDAELAGLSYSIRIVPRGIKLSFGGYNDKLQNFVAYISKKLSSADVNTLLPKDDMEFEQYKDLIDRTYTSFDYKQPYAHGAYYAKLLMQPPKFQYSNSQMRDVTNDASLDDLISYVNELWSSGKGLALIQGNVNEKEAAAVVSTIDQTLGFKSSLNSVDDGRTPPQLRPLPLPSIPIKSEPTKLIISEPNPNNSNSASYIVVQDLSEAPKEHILMEIIAQIVSGPFYDELRTKQQLGYIVSSGIRTLGKTRYLDFIVQSNVATTAKLTTEMVKYLDNIKRNLLEPLPKADLAIYVKSLIERKAEPDKKLATEVTRNWGEIGSGRLQFDRTQREVAALLEITKDDLLKYWDGLYVKEGDDCRRVLITETVPRVGVVSTEAPPLSFASSSSGGSDNKFPQSSSSEKDREQKVGLLLGIEDIGKFRENHDTLSTVI